MGTFPHRAYGPEHRELPLGEWPTHDRAAWKAACRQAGFLEASRPAAGWAPATRRRVQRGYGRYLGWMQLTGQLDQGVGPAARLTKANLEAFLAHLRPINAARSIITVLDSLILFIGALDIDGDVDLLRAMQRGLWHEVRDGRNKAQRLRHANELFELGLTLMRTADIAAARLWDAVQYRDGLMIALLSRRPLRVSNFVGLVIGRHLMQQGGHWWIIIAAQEVKNRRPLETRFPTVLVPYLEHYLNNVRSVLLQGKASPVGQEAVLWYGTNGRALSARRFHQCLCERTKAVFGLPVNPHLFRDSAATTIALEDSEHARIAAQILGHASFVTTERYYRMSRCAEATRLYQDVLDNLSTQRT